MRISNWSLDVCSSELDRAFVGPFVEADDHREPRMPDLVRADPEQFLARIVDAVEHDARIFHPRRRPRDVDRGGPGIGIPLGREALDRVLHIVGRSAPAIIALARSEEPTSELQSLMRISYAVLCL